MSGLTLALVVATAVASGVVGGVFYAFSAFVMAALRRLPAEPGMLAMQSVNITAVRAGLMIPFFGTAIASVAVAVLAVVDWDDATSVWLLVGAASYVLGVFAVTAGFHVPRNDALAKVPADDPSAPAAWLRYADEWTRGNHVRTAMSIVAALAYTIAIVQR